MCGCGSVLGLLCREDAAACIALELGLPVTLLWGDGERLLALGATSRERHSRSLCLCFHWRTLLSEVDDLSDRP